MKPIRSEGEPHDKLTRICDAMADTLQHHPEYDESIKCIVFLDDMTERRSGLVLTGWEDDFEAISHLIMHLRMIFRSNGKELLVMPLKGGPDS